MGTKVHSLHPSFAGDDTVYVSPKHARTSNHKKNTLNKHRHPLFNRDGFMHMEGEQRNKETKSPLCTLALFFVFFAAVRGSAKFFAGFARNNLIPELPSRC